MDSVFEVNAFLVESFAQLENATLELKTKTDEIEPLLGLDHKGHTVIAWSLNPQELIDSQEIRTASLEQRLKAAKRVVEDGYKVAFHFDPILHYQGWQAGYEETVELIFEHVSPRDIAWISMGTFRYIPKLKAIAEERFKRTAIFANEFIMAEDGKMRYLKPIRTEMLSKVSGFILKKAPKVPLYLCMEKRSVWDRIFAEHPQSPAELEAYLNSNLK
ncbi:MAG: hypothetical protein OEY59_02985 [Deltaproteobacteria bacterium]|nr:hypothetical protein [Deltaproteobacteria bacterium]